MVWHSSTTVSVVTTQLFNGEPLFYNMFWSFASKKSNAAFQKLPCVLPLQSAIACRPLLTKQWEES